jgi:hypothetical protein
MESYLFIGEVLPQRAQLSLEFGIKFSVLTSAKEASAKVSIVLNQIAITIETDEEFDIFDLRNVVSTIIQENLAMIGYIHGHAYDFEITRVINPARNVDYVFGIGIPDLAARAEPFDAKAVFAKIREKSTGTNGIFIRRCLNDLIFAMKHSNDTGFYCFRAIESLRHHLAASIGLPPEDRRLQWEKFREVVNFTEDDISPLTKASKSLRHGDLDVVDGPQRLALLELAWNVSDRYFRNI